MNTGFYYCRQCEIIDDTSLIAGIKCECGCAISEIGDDLAYMIVMMKNNITRLTRDLEFQDTNVVNLMGRLKLANRRANNMFLT